VDINWTTFLFEIANFLVLVWIVWRFLYRPVRDILDRRGKAIADEIAQGNAARAEAEEIRTRYESRLADWQAERQAALRKLEEELRQEREARLKALEAEIEERTAAARLLEERRLADLQDEAEKLAAANGAQLAARLLSLAATPELQNRLFRMALDDLATPPGDGPPAAGAEPPSVTVTSAFDIDGAQRKTLEGVLAARFGDNLSVRYETDPALLAGVCISVGAFEWAANLRDELRYFAESSHGQG